MKKFTVDGKEFTEAREVAQYIIDNADLTEDYNEMLDECYDMVNVCGYEYYPAYRGYSDFTDSLYADLESEIDRLEDGEDGDFYGYEVECIEDESEAA